MLFKRLACLVLGLVALATGAEAGSTVAQAKPEQRTAWFQTGSIFHAGLRENHIIALTFDDGPNANTAAVLDALKAANVKATFFVTGTMAGRHGALLARIAAEGHLLANHSATHPLLSAKYDATPRLLLDQIRKVDTMIAPLMKPGDKFYFRAPYGYWRSAHAAILNADPVLRHYVGPIYWDVGGDTIMRNGYVMSSADWNCWKRKWTAQVCAKGYLREIRRKNGGVVLMHSVTAKSGELVAAVIPPLLEEGYRFVRLDQIRKYRQYETPPVAPVAVASDGGGAIPWQLVK